MGEAVLLPGGVLSRVFLHRMMVPTGTHSKRRLSKLEETRTMGRLQQPRKPLIARTLPPYTRGEEIFNMVSHIVGAAFGVVVLVLCAVFAALHHNPAGVISGVIYAVSMIVCYTISSVYHGLNPNKPRKEHGKKVMQVLDHCDIYFLIAGTYTPVAFTGMRDAYPKTALITLGIVWGICALGTVFTAIDFHKYAVLSYSCYFVAGWSVLAAIPAMWHTYGTAFLVLFVVGGAVYTLGMIFFSLQKKYKYCHSIFHLFILGGSVLQFIPIFMYCI